MGLVLLLPLDTGQNSEDVSLYKEAPNEVFLFGPVARGENYSSSGSRRKGKRSPLTGQWLHGIAGGGPFPAEWLPYRASNCWKGLKNAKDLACAEAGGSVAPSLDKSSTVSQPN
jgi:hypothetical protein